MNNKQLLIHKIFYDYFLQNYIIDKVGKITDEELLTRIKDLALFAYLHHTGYFVDARIESIIANYGLGLESLACKENLAEIKYVNYDNAIYYIASKFYEVGGHTRVISEVVASLDSYKQQVLILTEQKFEAIPKWFVDENSNRLEIICLEDIIPEKFSSFDKAFLLRALTKSAYKIILSTNPEDFLPVLALSYENCPVVLFENHAHSWFWFGRSISDLVFSHTAFHVGITKKYREIDNNYLLKVKFDNKNAQFEFKDKLLAKQRLAIPEGKICITTIGTVMKFYPLSKQYNIFRLIQELLEKFENVYIVVVGLNADLKEINEFHLDGERVRFVGYQTDLTDYYLSSDICIDSIPEPSLGATVLAARIGLSCPLFKYGSAEIFDATNLFPNNLYSNYIGKLKNKVEFIEKLGFLILNEKIRNQIALEYKQCFLEDCNDELIMKNTIEMIKYSDSLIHEVKMNQSTVWHNDDNTIDLANSSAISIDSAIRSNLRYFKLVDLISIFFILFRQRGFKLYSIKALFHLVIKKRVLKQLFNV